MRSLLLIALVACSNPSKPAPTTDKPAPAADAAPAPVSWRGPNLYTLVDGKLTVGVVTMPPDGWAEDWAGAHEVVTSLSGSTFAVTIAAGAAAADPVQTATGYHQERAIGAWKLTCDVALVAADAALLDNLTKQCQTLAYQQEPDDRVAWAVEVSPATVKVADIPTVTIRYRATNRSQAPLDAMAYALEWQLDGAASMELGMAFGNGGYDAKRWEALPPGESVDSERSGLTLTKTAGDHVLSLHHLGHEVARATLHVQ